MPNKEEVLQWYNSLKETLKAEGIDVTKPGDLMRIKSLYYREDPDMPGDIVSGTGEIRYAFAKKNINPQTGLRTSYENPIPEISKEKQNDDFLAANDAFNNAHKLKGETLQELEKARKNERFFSKIPALKESYRLYEEEEKEADKKYRKFCDELWKEQDRWMLTNSRFFDPEQDYEQIEDLYNQAASGQLYLSDLSGNIKGRKQILVQKDGKSAVGPAYKDVDTDKMQHGDLYAARGQKKEKLEQKYGELPKLRRLPKRPKELPEPKKPGAFSWFKRIISFGFAKGDFVRYEQEKQACTQRKEDIRQYDEELPQLRKEIRQSNLAAYQCYDEIVSEEHRDEYPGVSNAGKMALMQTIIDRIDVSMCDDDGTDNVWNPTHEYARRNHMIELEIEYKESPESFHEDGTRNKDASEKYWDKKISINADVLKERAKTASKLDKAQVKNDLQDRILKEKSDIRKQNEVTDDYLSAEREDKYLLSFNPWIKQTGKELFTNIGKLYGMGPQYGMNIFLGVCMQNQKFDVEGNPRPQEEIKSNAECAMDLEQLVYYANHQPQSEAERQQLYDSTLGKFELVAEGLELKRALDSISAIVSDNVKDIDQTATYPHIAHAAALVPFLLAQNKQYDFIADGNEINGKDLSVSTPLDRELAQKFGVKCAKLQDGYQKKMAAHKEGFVKREDDTVKAAPAKNLNIKRPLNLGK